MRNSTDGNRHNAILYLVVNNIIIKYLYLTYRTLVIYLKCWGKNPSQFSSPQDKGGRGENKPIENCVKKRRVGNSHGHLRTRLETDVTSATSSLAIEGVKDIDGQDKLAGS